MIKGLYLEGSAKDIGYHHGIKGKEEVLNSIETYEKLFYHAKQINWTQAKELALKHFNAIEEYSPEMIEEMDGIAKGAGVEFEDILALNARSEIALAGDEKPFSDGCTSIAVTSPIINDTIIGQTWDWTSSQKKSLLLLKIKSNFAPAITMVTEGGIIGKIGYNAKGIGLCLNALITNKRTNQVPLHLGIRAILNSYTQAEAISRISKSQIASSANFLIGYDEGDGRGMALNTEVSPFGIDYVNDDYGWMSHTNHICSEFHKKNIKDLNDRRYEDSILRKKRADHLVKASIANKEKIDEQKFMYWLSDTFNKPSSINHYQNPKAPLSQQVETLFSIVMNLTKKRAYLRVGKEGDFNLIDKIGGN